VLHLIIIALSEKFAEINIDDCYVSNEVMGVHVMVVVCCHEVKV
jgi:hypothetical protein